MPGPLRWIISLFYVVQIYAAMLVIGLVFAPYALLSRDGAFMACKTYCRWVCWTGRWWVGWGVGVGGGWAQGEVMIAAKHQSFLGIMMIFHAVPRGKFIMKREILWTPIIGLYAKRLGCVPVNRGKRGAAIAKMVKDVAREFADPGQLIIYSQGTRVAPGVKKPYKVGTGVLYADLGQTCVPAATNVGLFWPRKGILRKPGLAVVEFLDPIAPGMARDTFMATLERRVEECSDKLMREAGFDPDGLHNDAS